MHVCEIDKSDWRYFEERRSIPTRCSMCIQILRNVFHIRKCAPIYVHTYLPKCIGWLFWFLLIFPFSSLPPFPSTLFALFFKRCRSDLVLFLVHCNYVYILPYIFWQASENCQTKFECNVKKTRINRKIEKGTINATKELVRIEK